MQKTRIIIDIDENNNIQTTRLFRFGEGSKEKIDMHPGEVLTYVLEICNGLQLIDEFDKQKENEARKDNAEIEYKVKLLKESIIMEALEQACLIPFYDFKSNVVKFGQILVKVINLFLPQKIREKLDTWYCEVSLNFLFGKENVEKMIKALSEGKRKIYGLE